MNDEFTVLSLIHEIKIPLTIASGSLVFQCSATLLSSGSSGLGADNNAWMLSKTVLIWSAGDHLSLITWF